MDLLFRLPRLRVVDVHETFEEVQCTVEVDDSKPPCPACKKVKHLGPHGTLETGLADVPIRGKRASLIVRRKRFQCKCGATCSEDVPPVADKTFPSLTLRLARYIENQSLRRPMSHIATEVGVSKSVVRRLVKALAERLYDHHYFPTPTVLGIDDLRIRKKLFTNVTDGRTGYSIALVDGGDAHGIQWELNRRKIDVSKVKVVVSDMGGSNIAVFKELFGLPIIHVADKWHVLKGAKEAVNAVINKRLDHLRRRRAWCEKIYKRRGTMPPINPKDPHYKRKPPFSTHPLTRMQHRIDEFRNAKPKLLGMRRPFYADKQLTLNDVQMVILPMCKKHPTVGKAFFAKMRLHAVYDVKKCGSRANADRQIDLFIRRASSKSIAAQFKVIVERVKTHRNIILNFYDAIALLGPDHPAPTTGPTEQRNSTIKAAWSGARGIRDHKLFSMRALYEPWHLDVDIAICSADSCKVIDGPFPGQAAARRARVMQPLHAHRCAACS